MYQKKKNPKKKKSLPGFCEPREPFLTRLFSPGFFFFFFALENIKCVIAAAAAEGKKKKKRPAHHLSQGKIILFARSRWRPLASSLSSSELNPDPTRDTSLKT